MLVLKNAGKVISEAGKPLVNNEVNALRIENTDRITIGFVTTGPIALSWGDGTALNLGTQAARYNASKLYGAVGNWNIVVTNPENVKGIYFDFSSTTSINTSVSWFSLFVNLEIIYLDKYSTFNGDLAPVVEKLNKLTYLTLYNVSLSATNFSFNISNCKNFWKRCKYISLYNSGICGSISDVDLNPECEFINFNTVTLTGGSVNGILKNGYTKATYFNLYTGTTWCSNFQDFQDWIIPDTLITLSNIRGVNNSNKANWGIFNNFNFKNLTTFGLECTFSEADLTGNASFENFQNKCVLFSIYWTTGPVKFDVAKFNRSTSKYNVINLNMNNAGFGDATNILNNTIYSLVIRKTLVKSDIFGQLPVNFGSIITTGVIILDNNSISADAGTIKAYLNRQSSDLWFGNIDNFTGDISGANFVTKTATTYYGIRLCGLKNVSADITTFTWVGSNYANTSNYCLIDFSNNPLFTGNLANMPLWANKYKIDLSYCAYTNIPGFVRKVFANRNTCLKAAGGMTAIYVQGNVDNNLLTGIEQPPPLGSYTGNVNNLTEVQIDNLAAGKDYTGVGTSTPWTDKEKIWVMTKLKNSSTDSNLRYRCTFSY